MSANHRTNSLAYRCTEQKGHAASSWRGTHLICGGSSLVRWVWPDDGIATLDPLSMLRARHARSLRPAAPAIVAGAWLGLVFTACQGPDAFLRGELGTGQDGTVLTGAGGNIVSGRGGDIVSSTGGSIVSGAGGNSGGSTGSGGTTGSGGRGGSTGAGGSGGGGGSTGAAGSGGRGGSTGTGGSAG